MTPYAGFKNRIINGAMVIDQRNAGASIGANTSAPYTLDRYYAYAAASSKFTVQQNAGSVTPPAGFSKYLGVTSSAATSLSSGDSYTIGQNVEGFNIADLNWGSANASSITLSFKVYSSLTGTFGGCIKNSDANRSYPFTYTISSSNTWTSTSVTIPGDTTGTWLTTNGLGMQLIFGLGVGSTYSGTAGAWASANYNTATGGTSVVGTNGATWYITGIQLEKGSTATSFDWRPYGTELQLCQRYYEMSYNQGTAVGSSTGIDGGAMAGVGVDVNDIVTSVLYSAPKRAAPTITLYNSTTGVSGGIYDWTNGLSYTGVGVGNGGQRGFSHITLIGAVTTPHGYSFHFTSSAEL